MEASPPSSASARIPARHARELLVAALATLQSDRTKTAKLTEATENVASASSALYEAENTASTPQATTSGIRIAIEQLGCALTALHEHERETAATHPATEAVARTVALLYPVARASLRQRREVMLGSDQDPESIESLRALAQIPPAPEPFGRPRRNTPPFAGQEHRAQGGERAFLEVDIGLLSDSYFYTGLSQDLSRGGVFVATYQRKPPGTHIALYFVLPDGHAVSADGVVRWTRDASDDLPPGMGISFENLNPRDVTAIGRYCRARAPLYHDFDDD